MTSIVDRNIFKSIWDNGIIVFDTCSLGRMFEWEYRHAINIKDVLSYLLEAERLWETQYNCDEFNDQKDKIKNSIHQQKYEKGIFNQLVKSPIPWVKIDKTLHRWESRGYSPSFICELNKLRQSKKIDAKEIDDLRVLSRNFCDFPDVDYLFSLILKESDVFLSEDEKNRLIERYDSGILCPGCCDRDKNNGKKYNDLFIWELIKKKALQSRKDVIFVTSDTKSDWFINGSPRSKYIGEFQRETDKKIIILTLVDFWECCQPYIDLPIENFLLQSTILEQLQEKYDDCYEHQICVKVEELIYDSSDIRDALAECLDCCVDMPVLDQIDSCTIDDIHPMPYERSDDYVKVTIEMTLEITFDGQNHTAGEDWSAGSKSILFNVVASGSIPIKWASEDTERILLVDLITVDEVTDMMVNQIIDSDSDDDQDENIDEFYDESSEDYDDVF